MPLFGIDRIAQTRDGMAVAFSLRDDTAEQIDLVTFRHSDQDIRVLQISILQDTVACAVSQNTHDIKPGRHIPDAFRIHVHYNNIMIFF